MTVKTDVNNSAINDSTQGKIPLGLYIHFPWCIQKCPYCDFNSHVNNESLHKPYMETLAKDLAVIQPYIAGREVESIFIGGGTPSLMPPDLLATFLEEMKQLVTLKPDIEVTMEANPGTTDIGFFKAYHELGINRLSIGVQSLDDEALKKIGRIHDSQTALNAIEMAQQVGFEEINCDLMFGLPEQSLKKARYDVTEIIARNPTHISHYQLTLEPNTYFYKYPPKLPHDEDIEEMQLGAYELFREHGYHHYEVSAFAKKGFECRHNINYWSFGDYIGIGAGAHGKLTLNNQDKEKARIIRTVIERHPRTYVEKSPQERLTISQVKKEDLPFEFFLNSLRLKEGVPLSFWQERTLLPIHTIETLLATLKAEGWLESSPERIQTTPRGFLFANHILESFLSE